MADASPVRSDAFLTATDIWRDAWGIPHIRAANDRDAFAGLGFAHAQDRLWHMEMMRRKAVGRWAEWVGESGVASDRLARIVGAEAAALRDFAALGDEAQSMLEAYAAGVNAFLALPGELPLEYRLLGAAPERWEPWHSIAVMRQIGFLMGSVWMKLLRAAALPVLGPEHVGKLRYDDGGCELLCTPWAAEAARPGMPLAELREAIADLLRTGAPDLTAGGSNNWALSGTRTASGRPVLMGDPHRELEVPAMYSQAHIAGATFDAIGLTVPGVPGFPHVAHNGAVAWCVTVSFMDLHDLYLEVFREDGLEVRTPGGWEAVRQRRETIRVRGRDDVALTVTETRHGPVIAGDPRSGHALALRSAQFDAPDRSFDCLPRMLRAGGVEALREATRGWGLIDHNMVAADTAGAIAHWVRAIVPDRPRANGWLPVPGWVAEHDWRGEVPFEHMPHQIDPSSGIIVTANNRVVADRGWPYLSTDCHPPHRARRIVARLEALERPDMGAMEAIFGDVESLPARLFRDRLIPLDLSGPVAALRDRIVAWDGAMRGASEEAAAYSRLRLHATRLVARLSSLSDPLPHHGSLMASSAILTHLWWAVPTLLRDDDTALLGGQDWAGVLREALEETAGDGADGAAWETLHVPRPRHPLSSLFPDSAALLDPPCAPVGGDCDTVMATGYHAGEGLRATYSSLARYAFEPGDWDACRWIVFQGVSGHHDSRHRSDQNKIWASVEMVPMLYRWDRIASLATSRTSLRPRSDARSRPSSPPSARD
ncbi:penicillin acylase family protein [Muricoccus pecuniae]|uniref:Penicillin amidase n=1 Tax=Muricoccus pecuniae TaxID=693023 RepID=A0A840YMW8_9PROT|nr:penicillin acylase family protein [Roseomonas pecuniae]MBB5696493.1 penicillin amidase [Roseomonas pecuniae]